MGMSALRLAMSCQALYEMKVELRLADYGPSAGVTETFGIRTIQSEIDPDLNGHVFLVNGHRVGLWWLSCTFWHASESWFIALCLSVAPCDSASSCMMKLHDANFDPRPALVTAGRGLYCAVLTLAERLK